MDKKKRDRLARAKARREALARGESDDRVERIKVLEKELSRKRARDWLSELSEGELGATLEELLSLFKEENEYLMKLRAEWERVCEFCPSELEALKSKSELAWAEQLSSTGAIELTSTPRQKSEWKRSRLSGVGLIEREFGSVPFFAFGPPTCLDDIFRGGSLNMVGLQDLFGLGRKRFPQKLHGQRSSKGIVYGFGTIILIMDALLSEEPSMSKKPRRLWLVQDPDLLRRVLEGIAARLESLPQVPEDIARAFLAIVRKHLR
jgi:hypothetical protein